MLGRDARPWSLRLRRQGHRLGRGAPGRPLLRAAPGPRADLRAPEYAFALGCQDDGCGARFGWDLELGELPVRRLSDESFAAFTAGNRFETTLPDVGVRVWFRLFTGADKRRLPQLRRRAGDRTLSAMLGWRVLEVGGVPEKDKRRFLEDLSLRDADFLADEFDRVDFGVDRAIVVEGRECFDVQELELPYRGT